MSCSISASGGPHGRWVEATMPTVWLPTGVKWAAAYKLERALDRRGGGSGGREPGPGDRPLRDWYDETSGLASGQASVGSGLVDWRFGDDLWAGAAPYRSSGEGRVEVPEWSRWSSRHCPLRRPRRRPFAAPRGGQGPERSARRLPVEGGPSGETAHGWSG